MKRIMIALALILSVQALNAQEVRTPSEVKAAVESSKKASLDAKKAAKVATWIKLGKNYLDAYVTAQGNGSVGMSEADIELLMTGEKNAPVSQETVMGVPMKKVAYSTADYYFQGGRLAMIDITNPIVPNSLENAFEAFRQAYKVDDKGQKTADITAGLKKIHEFYSSEAFNAYRKGENNVSSEAFEKAYLVSVEAPLSSIDTASLYNAGFVAWEGGDYERARKFITLAIDNGFPGEGGDGYVKLADIAQKTGDQGASKKYLEEGFKKFPESQGILVGLINYYMTSGDSSKELFVLLDQAKANEPGNASLYYVEGNVHKKLGEFDEAVAAYDKCAEVDPTYDFGYIGKGILYYEKALEYQELASNELNDAKWNELNQKFESSLKSCIEPFEKAFEITKDASVKKSICEYLKNAFFRFRSEGEEYQQKYDKYAAEFEK